jgi:hypothetical protein
MLSNSTGKTMSDKPAANAAPQPKAAPALPIEEIREAVEKIRFGTVQLIIQDGRVVQIDTTEKRRLA